MASIPAFAWKGGRFIFHANLFHFSCSVTLGDSTTEKPQIELGISNWKKSKSSYNNPEPSIWPKIL